MGSDSRQLRFELLPVIISLDMIETIIVVLLIFLINYVVLNVLLPYFRLRNIPSMPWNHSFRLLASDPLSPIQEYRLLPKYFKKVDDTDSKSSWSIRKLFFFNQWIIVVSDPALARSLLVDMELFIKPVFNTMPFPNLMQKVVGLDNLVLINGEQWKRQRRLLNPVFRQKWQESEFAKLLGTMIREWGINDKSDLKIIEVTGWMQRLTLDTLGKFIFDFDFNSLEDEHSDLVQKYNRVMDPLFELWTSLTPSYQFLRWIFPAVDRAHRSKEEFDKIIYSLIDEKIKNPGDDLFSRLVQSNNVKDEIDNAEMAGKKDLRLTHQELRSNAFIFFVGGHDTTSSALSSILYHLAKHQDVQERLYDEITKALGIPELDEDLLVPPTQEDFLKMPYLNAIIKETMRLYPPAVMLQRRTARECEVAGNQVPANTLILLNLLELQRNQEAWKDPDVFNPERFLHSDDNVSMKDGSVLSGSNEDLIVSEKEGSSNFVNPAWIAFGHGPRSCIGQTLSLAEQRIYISMLVRHFKIKLPADSKVKDELKLAPTISVLLKIMPFELEFERRSL